MTSTHKSYLEQLGCLLTLAQQSTEGRELAQIKNNAQQLVDIFCVNSRNLSDVIIMQKILQKINAVVAEKARMNLLQTKLTKAYENIINSIQSSIKFLLPILQRHQNRHLIILQKILLNPIYAEKILQEHNVNDRYICDTFTDMANILAELTPADHEFVVQKINLFIKQNVQLWPDVSRDTVSFRHIMDIDELLECA